MKNKISFFVFAGLLFIAYAVMMKSKSVPPGAARTDAEARLQSPAGVAQLAELKVHFGAISPEQAITELRRSSLQIRLEEPSAATSSALAALAAGLSADNENIRWNTAMFVQNLLIDVAHGRSIDASYDTQLTALFSIYKARAPDLIKKMRTAFPESRTLAYLQTIKE